MTRHRCQDNMSLEVSGTDDHLGCSSYKSVRQSKLGCKDIGNILKKLSDLTNGKKTKPEDRGAFSLTKLRDQVDQSREARKQALSLSAEAANLVSDSGTDLF
jgi:hypothetical protein